MVEEVEDHMHLPLIVRCKVVVVAAVVVKLVHQKMNLLEVVTLVMHYLMVNPDPQV